MTPFGAINALPPDSGRGGPGQATTDTNSVASLPRVSTYTSPLPLQGDGESNQPERNHLT